MSAQSQRDRKLIGFIELETYRMTILKEGDEVSYLSLNNV